MFIIPIQDRVDWRRPPVLALILVILNSVIYFWSVGYDAERYAELERVDDAKLSQYEWPLYLDWLRDTDPAMWLEVRADDDAPRMGAMQSAWFNRAFDQQVYDLWEADAPEPAWRELRGEMERARDQLTWIRWGFTPALPTFSGAVISMFLHGGPWHLFGNMLFLLLFAVPLEKHWGAGRLLGLYLLAGLCGDALHWLAAMNSYVPSIGASGAVSGLMGIYVATYGVRRIEFFYTLGFWFGSFRAPALMVFPVWLSYELLNQVLSDSNVNYLAHAGGMSGGLLLTLALNKLTPRGEPDSVEKEVDEKVRQAAPVPAYLQRLHESLAFDQVVKDCQGLLPKQPDNQALWHFYLSAAAKCGVPALDKAMSEALALLNKKLPPDALVADLLEDYASFGGDLSRMPPPFQLLEAEMHYRRRDVKRATERVIQLEKIWSHARLNKLQEQLMRR